MLPWEEHEADPPGVSSGEHTILSVEWASFVCVLWSLFLISQFFSVSLSLSDHWLLSFCQAEGKS